MSGDEEGGIATEIDSLLGRSIPVENRRGGLNRLGESLSSFFATSNKRGGNGETGGNHRRARTHADITEFPRNSIANRLEALTEDVQFAAREVRDAFASELREADRGENFFLETGMMRSLAVLPNDMEEMIEEAAKTTGRVVVDALEGLPSIETPTGGGRLSVGLGPYLSLLGAVAAISSNGTAMSLLRGVAPPLKVYWRMTATASFLAPWAAHATLAKGDGWPQLTVGQWVTFGMAVLCFSTQVLLFVAALSYTTIGNAVIYSNTQALILLMGKAAVGEKVVWMEGLGAMVAFSGAILCSSDSEGPSGKAGEDGYGAILGDVFAFSSAIGGVGYLTFAKAVRPHMKVTVFMFLVMFSGSFLVLLFMVLSNVPVTFNHDPQFGLFGWLSWRPDRLLLEAWVVIVCNVMGSMGFVKAMQYFDNITIAVATLAEPMVASFIAYICGVGLLPGFLGWTGNVLVAVGTIGVVYPSIGKGSQH